MRSLFLILAILFVGCSTDNTIEDHSVEIPFSLIGKEILSPSESINPNRSNLVIKDSKTWYRLLAQLNKSSFNKVSDNFLEVKIDFTKYQVIAVIDQVYTTGGYSIDIISIKDENKSIQVKVDNLQKGGDNYIMIQPFHIVKIPKTNRKVHFIQANSDF